MPFCKALLIKTYLSSFFFLDGSPFWGHIYRLYHICKFATFFVFMFFGALSLTLFCHLISLSWCCVLILKLYLWSLVFLTFLGEQNTIINICSNSPGQRNKSSCQVWWRWETYWRWFRSVLCDVCVCMCISWSWYLRTVIQRDCSVREEVTEDLTYLLKTKLRVTDDRGRIWESTPRMS